jgi:hypothetical protein
MIELCPYWGETATWGDALAVAPAVDRGVSVDARAGIIGWGAGTRGGRDHADEEAETGDIHIRSFRSIGMMKYVPFKWLP